MDSCRLLALLFTIYSVNSFFHFSPRLIIRNKPNAIRSFVSEYFLHLYNNITLNISWDSGEIPWDIKDDDDC
jgi:hypothetical protein